MKKPPFEVDLHTQAILRNTYGLSPEDMIEESIIKLRETLDAAIYHDYAEIRFIHGKGKGVLKDRVYEELAYYKREGRIASYHPAFHNKDVVVVNIGL